VEASGIWSLLPVQTRRSFSSRHIQSVRATAVRRDAVLAGDLSRTVLPHDSRTHHPPSGTHKLSRHYQNASRDPRDVGTPSEELMHLIMLRNMIPPWSVPLMLRFYFGQHHMFYPCPFLSICLCDILPYDFHSLSLWTCSRCSVRPKGWENMAPNLARKRRDFQRISDDFGSYMMSISAVIFNLK